MDQSTALSAVDHAIQLSVAPVFLLSAISAMATFIAGPLCASDRSERVMRHARLPLSS